MKEGIERQLIELLNVLCDKNDKSGLTQYEEGIKDILDLINDYDGYGIDAMIEDVKR